MSQGAEISRESWARGSASLSCAAPFFPLDWQAPPSVQQSDAWIQGKDRLVVVLKKTSIRQVQVFFITLQWITLETCGLK